MRSLGLLQIVLVHSILLYLVVAGPIVAEEGDDEASPHETLDTGTTDHIGRRRRLSYDDLLLPPNYQQEARTLSTLSRVHNSSAILHFIELSHNFTATELDQCRRVSLLALNYSVGHQPYQQFAHQAEIATRTAHILTNIFSSHFESNVSLHHVIEKKELYWSLLVANLQSHRQLYGNGLAFSTNILNTYLPGLKYFAPYLYRWPTTTTTTSTTTSDNTDEQAHNADDANGGGSGSTLTNDTVRVNLVTLRQQLPVGTLSAASSSSSSSSPPTWFNGEWAWRDWFANYDNLVAEWEALKVYNYVSGAKGVWSSPYLDCGLTKKWLVTFLVPFFKVDTNRLTLA